MGMGCKRAIASGLIAGLILTTAAIARAGDDILDSPANGFAPVPDAMDEAFFDHDRIFFTNRKIFRQFDALFGISAFTGKGFTDIEIDRDGKSVFDAYRIILSHQLESGPMIRTIDLNNPFNLSLDGIPPVGPLRAAPAPPPVVITPTPLPLPPQPPKAPVPALW